MSNQNELFPVEEEKVTFNTLSGVAKEFVNYLFLTKMDETTYETRCSSIELYDHFGKEEGWASEKSLHGVIQTHIEKLESIGRDVSNWFKPVKRRRNRGGVTWTRTEYDMTKLGLAMVVLSMRNSPKAYEFKATFIEMFFAMDNAINSIIANGDARLLAMVVESCGIGEQVPQIKSLTEMYNEPETVEGQENSSPESTS